MTCGSLSNCADPAPSAQRRATPATTRTSLAGSTPAQSRPRGRGRLARNRLAVSRSRMETPEPPRDCPLCPRLVEYRVENQGAHPDWWNGPAPSFGDPEARLLVLGWDRDVRAPIAPGGPFTGDFAGVLLYETLIAHGFAVGTYGAAGRRAAAGGLHDLQRRALCAAGEQAAAGRGGDVPAVPYRPDRALPRLRVIVTLGDVARRNLMRALWAKRRRRGRRAWRRDAGRRVDGDQQLSLLAAEHEHRPADGGDVRECVREGEKGVGGAVAALRNADVIVRLARQRADEDVRVPVILYPA